MPHHHSSAVSSDLIWEITRAQNSFLVKRSSSGPRFSRDPYNLLNIHSRKQSGYVNEKAVSIVPAEGDKGGVTLITKKTAHPQRPSKSIHKTTFGGNKTTRKTYKAIASQVAKSGYRADLRSTAIARASAIRLSQKPKKDAPVSKPRGKKAKAVAAEDDDMPGLV